MIPWETLARAQTPDATEMVLCRRGQEYVLRVGGAELMSSRRYRSEERLAQLTCPGRRRVLLGGLGLGRTLEAALQLLPASSELVVVELIPEVVSWNREYLGMAASLDDPRVRVEVGDVAQRLDQEAAWDAIVLDVDNGPDALTCRANFELYGEGGLARARRGLRPGGILGVWSAGPDQRFEERLREARFSVEAVRVKRHVIYCATRVPKPK